MITGAGAPARNRSLLAFVAAAALFALLAAQLAVLGARDQIFSDFHAFYCGGKIVLQSGDPYANAALAACEAQRYGLGLHFMQRGVAAPVPFPGYVFPLFALFALLPYKAACVLWMLLTLGCLAIAARVLSGLTRIPLWSTLALLAASYPMAVLGLGEVAAVVLAALCVAAAALREKRFAAAAAALCVAAILPNVAGPAILCVLLFAPRARVAMVCGIGVLVLLDVVVGGPTQAVQYIMEVLPAHAHSEIGYIAQYGIPWAVHAAGGSDSAALGAGEICFAASLVAGLWIARMLEQRTNDTAFLAAIPCAFAVAFGPFVHYSEITLAFPAVLLILAYARGAPRALGYASLVLLAFAWQWIVGEPQLAVPVAIASAFAITWTFANAAFALRAAVGATLYAALLLLVALHFGPQVQHLAAGSASSPLAQTSWTAYIRSQGASAGAAWWIAKAPTWIGLLLLAASAYLAIAKKYLIPRVAVERVPAVR